MTAESTIEKKMVTIRERLQRDVDIILENSLIHTSKDEIFEDHFDVDAIIQSEIPLKRFGQVNQKISNTKYVNNTKYTFRASRGIDETMNPIDPHFYEERNISKKAPSSRN